MGHKIKSRAGMTLIELMAVVAILVIVTMLAIPAVGKYQKDLSAQQMDNNAQVIFVAAQNRLAALRAAGTVDKLFGKEELKATELPADCPADKTPADLRFLSSAAHPELMKLLLPTGAIDPELRKGYFVVEFDLSTGAVYGVIYAQSSFSYPLTETAESSPRLSPEARRDYDPALGYYGGSVVTQISGTVSSPQPTMTVENGEELKLTIKMPENLGSVNSENIRLSLTATDANGNEVPLLTDAKLFAGKTGTIYLDTYADHAATPLPLLGADWTLSGPFKEWVKSSPEFDMADDMELKLTTTYTDGGQTRSNVVRATANPLFASGSAGAVRISCGRHLQNLDAATSGVSGVSSAAQTREISFAADSQWARVYPEKTSFTPIENPSLTAYDGGGQPIAGLTVNVTGDAGLFQSFAGGSLSNVALVDAKITGTGNTGALAGAAADAAIRNCRVFLHSDSTGVKPRIVGGASTGGLVGYAQNTDITGSFASTVAAGTARVGGLAGKLDGGSVSGSYAACYLSASSGAAAGLVADADGTRFGSVYASGAVQTAQTACGLAGGTPALDAATCYAAMSYQTASKIYGAGPASPKVRYLALPGEQGALVAAGSGQDIGSAALAKADLKTLFQPGAAAGAGGTVCYDLAEQGLTGPYPFPKLTGLPHYGDWPMQGVDDIAIYDADTGETPRHIVYLLPGGKEATVYAQPTQDGKALADQPVTVGGGVSGLDVSAGMGASGRTAITLRAASGLAAGCYSIRVSSGEVWANVLAVVCDVDLSLTVGKTVNHSSGVQSICTVDGLGKKIDVKENKTNLSIAVAPTWSQLSAAATEAGCADELPEQEQWTAAKDGDPAVTLGADTVVAVEEKNNKITLTTIAKGRAEVSLRWAINEDAVVTCPIQVGEGA